MIPSSEISVIVQGMITTQYTHICLKSLRALLPDAEIILSTTSTIPEGNFNCDDLVISPDPGAEIIDTKNHIYNNVNRQLVSTKAGLQKARRKYSLKFRTDMELISIDWLKYFGKYESCAPASLFHQRVMICNYYTRNPRIIAVPFHPSDWVMFGLTEDLISYYSTPLQSRAESTWFINNPKQCYHFKDLLARYVPEQYLCIEFLRRHYPVKCQNYYDISDGNIELSERFFAENTIILDYKKQMGIRFLKYNPNRYSDKITLISHKDWLNLFRNYCLASNSLLWKKYLLRCYFCNFVLVTLRRQVISLLDFLHLKNIIKVILNHIR